MSDEITAVRVVKSVATTLVLPVIPILPLQNVLTRQETNAEHFATKPKIAILAPDIMNAAGLGSIVKAKFVLPIVLVAAFIVKVIIFHTNATIEVIVKEYIEMVIVPEIALLNVLKPVPEKPLQKPVKAGPIHPVQLAMGKLFIQAPQSLVRADILLP